MLDSPSGLNFRFAGGFYSSGANEQAENVSGLIGLSMEGIGEVECESQVSSAPLGIFFWLIIWNFIFEWSSDGVVRC